MRAIAREHDGGWRSCIPHAKALRIPNALAERLDAGEVILISGRYSTSAGEEAARMAVDDLLGAVEVARILTGIDFEPLLPPSATLAEHLLRRAAVRSERSSGQHFENRFLVVDRSRFGVVFLVGTGSGHHLDSGNDQPFIRQTAELLKLHGACAYICKRVDRSGRQDWGFRDLALALRGRRAYFGDQDGFGPFDEMRNLMLFMRGAEAAREADNLSKKSRWGQASRTGSEMVNGQVAYAHPSAPPPGFGVANLKMGAVSATARILYIDTESCRPPHHRVATGLSEVRDDEGRRVDQAENIQFVLSVYGRPDWTISRIRDEMVSRRFSTDNLRRHHNRADAAVDRSNAKTVLKSVIDNLELYETGQLVRQLGEHHEPIVITGCFPPSGRWASPDDFRRIRDHLNGQKEKAAKAVSLSFAGVGAVYGDTKVRMRTTTNGRWRKRPAYKFVTGDRRSVEGPPHPE